MSFTLNDITTKTSQLINQGDSSVIGSLLDLIYPIGSIYMNVNDTCPSLFLGGVWERIQDKFLLCSGNSYNSGSVGGSATKTLKVENIPSHGHSINSQGAHTHSRGTMDITGTVKVVGSGSTSQWTCNMQSTGAFYEIEAAKTQVYASTVENTNDNTASAGFQASRNWTGETSSNGDHTHTVGNTGSGVAFDVMPPYLAVFVWKRIA